MQANFENVEVSVQGIPAAWDCIKSWTERVFTKENMLDVALFSATLASLAVVQFALFRALESWTITGGGVASFGVF